MFVPLAGAVVVVAAVVLVEAGAVVVVAAVVLVETGAVVVVAMVVDVVVGNVVLVVVEVVVDVVVVVVVVVVGRRVVVVRQLEPDTAASALESTTLVAARATSESTPVETLSQVEFIEIIPPCIDRAHESGRE